MNRIVFFLFCILPVSLNAQTGIISTVAGNGIAGYGLDGVAATSTKIGGALTGLTFDDTGNYYFTLNGPGFNRIRKVTTTGVMYTIAGTGTAGYSGDSGLAISAELNTPYFIAFDKNGNLYFSDVLNNRIRKINMATGIIYTFAGNGTAAYGGDGGPAIAAELHSPTGICFDTAGNLYIADQGNYRIRKIDTAGIIHPYAGSGVSGISVDGELADTTTMTNLADICIDKSGNLYVSEIDSIFKIDAITGIIHRIAGNGITGDTGDGESADSASLGAIDCIAINAQGELFLSDKSGYSVIRKIDTAGIIHHVAGTGFGGYNGDGMMADTAELYEPRGIAFDVCGNLFINDNGNFRVRKVTMTPILTIPTISLSGIASEPTGSTVTVNATVTNAGSSYEIYWMDHGIEFTTTTVPYVTYTKMAGIDTITAKVVPTGYGCWDSTTSSGWVVNVNTEASPILSKGEGLSVYPNPVKNSLTLTLSQGEGTAKYRLLSIVGSILQQGVLQQGNNNISMEAFVVGIYLLEVTDGQGGKTVMKIIKQ